MRRIDLAKGILENEGYLFDDICPYCYHLLLIATGDEDEGKYLYCPNEMCLDNTRHPTGKEN